MTTAGKADGEWIARHQLAVFVVLALALSWSVWPLVVLNPASSPMVPFGPALAALAATALAGGRRAVLDLLRQLTRWRAARAGTSPPWPPSRSPRSPASSPWRPAHRHPRSTSWRR